jgi:hypothetical protein
MGRHAIFRLLYVPSKRRKSLTHGTVLHPRSPQSPTDKNELLALFHAAWCSTAVWNVGYEVSFVLTWSEKRVNIYT